MGNDKLKWQFLDAAQDGDLKQLKILIDIVEDINCTTDDNWTALLEASVHGPELTRLLLSKGANPNIASNRGFTPLMRAAGHGNIEVVKLLLKSGANINLRDINRKTAYDLALEGRYRDTAALIAKS
jgi:uncharacterized protein